MIAPSDFENFVASQRNALPETDARKRLRTFFDPDTFVEIAGYMEQSKEEMPLVCGYGKVSGHLVYAFSQGGAMGKEHVEKMKKVYGLALKTRSPIVGLYDSHGLDLSHGMAVLNACGDLLAYQSKLSGVVPQISIVLGPCIGINATLAAGADMILMSSTASFFAAPPAYDTPDNAGSADNAGKAGIAHIVEEDNNQTLLTACRLLDILLRKKPSTLFIAPKDTTEFLQSQGEAIGEANIPLVMERIFDEGTIIPMMPLFGTNVYAFVSTLEGQSVGVLTTLGSSLSTDDCVKIARLVSVFDNLNLPLITLVNTEEMAGETTSAARDMAKIAHVYANATVPKISVIIGKAYGSGYIALASRSTNADYTVAWPKAIISPLHPRSAVAFLQGGAISETRSREEIEAHYIAETASALRAAQDGLIDDVIEPASTRSFLLTTLSSLGAKEGDRTGFRHRKHGNIPF